MRPNRFRLPVEIVWTWMSGLKARINSAIFLINAADSIPNLSGLCIACSILDFSRIDSVLLCDGLGHRSLRRWPPALDNRKVMNCNPHTNKFVLSALVFLIAAVTCTAQQADAIPESRRMKPEELVKIMQSSSGEKPLMIDVGSHVLYSQAHIPGSEYIGPASTPDGLERLRKRIQSLPRGKFIIIYCGCCPWAHCPNVKPADEALQALGFSHVKVLYIANNFGSDWVAKGYPVAKGD
jgi:thiosulfate/3-mercaptopyruvate sulfurtransferase